MLLTHFERNGRQKFFKESRLLGASLGAGLDSIKGKAKQLAAGGGKVVEKAGIAKEAGKKFWGWLSKPTGVLSAPIKVPAWALHQTGRIPFRLYQGANEYVKKRTAEFINQTREGATKILNRTSNIAYSAARSGVYLIAAPPFEAFYGHFIRLPLRAIVKNYFAVFNTLYNVIATPVARTVAFGKESFNYLKNIFGVRNVISNVLTGTKALFNRDFKEMAKNYAMAPLQPFVQMAKVPLALAAIPVFTGAQVALGGAEVAANMTSAALVPVETTLNGYRYMAKSTDFFRDLSKETGRTNSFRERLGGIRDKISNIFVPQGGFAYA